MKISKKCQYALKAILEIARRNTGETVKTHDIASSQRISQRFTEIILNELKHGGFVESRRGNEGGYLLARDPKTLTVREVVEYIQGEISVAPEAFKDNGDTSLFGNEAFKELWREVNQSISEVCTNKTFADLIDFEKAKREKCVPNYNI
ncbi:MAG: Rrf2 family transcriptional regulator [Sedimentisphaerales bacterium]|nr:Rrf2 family transcriptional regulator [Sedimentisphaerales bacterium]